MKKYLKKGDILVLISIVLISILLFFMSFSKISIKSDKAEIIYNNTKLYIFDINTDAIFEIKTSDDLTAIILTKNGNVVKTIEYNKTKKIYNKLEVKNGSIHMMNANCENKDCMKVTIDESHNLPIICTNGISVLLVDGDIEIDVLS